MLFRDATLWPRLRNLSRTPRTPNREPGSAVSRIPSALGAAGRGGRRRRENHRVRKADREVRIEVIAEAINGRRQRAGEIDGVRERHGAGRRGRIDHVRADLSDFLAENIVDVNLNGDAAADRGRIQTSAAPILKKTWPDPFVTSKTDGCGWGVHQQAAAFPVAL